MPIPTNSSDQNKYGVKVHSSNDIIWQGPDIACINLCKGDTVSDVVYKIAELLCDTLLELDLTSVNFDCLPLNQLPKNVKTAIQLLIQGFCDLKDQVLALADSSSGVGAELILVTLKCLQRTDCNGDLIPPSSNSEIIQAIIDKVCDHEDKIEDIQDDITDIKVDIINLELAVDNLSTGGSGVSVMPQVASDCLFTGTLALDDAWAELDEAYCELSSVIGTASELEAAIAKQCTGDLIADQYSQNPDYILNATNVADVFGNTLVILCDLLTRVTHIENTCCRLTCDDVLVGFNVAFSDDRKTGTIIFSYGAGTSIPEGFEDCGSVLTISDADGNQMQVFLAIENNLQEEIDFEGGGLNFKSNFIFSLNTCMSNEETGVECQKCVTKSFTYNDTCSFCELQAIGDPSLTAYILYTDNVTGVQKSLSLVGGQSAVLKRNITIDYVAADSGLVLISDCSEFQDVLSEPNEKKCYQFNIPLMDKIDGINMLGQAQTIVNPQGFPSNFLVIDRIDLGNGNVFDIADRKVNTYASLDELYDNSSDTCLDDGWDTDTEAALTAAIPTSLGVVQAVCNPSVSFVLDPAIANTTAYFDGPGTDENNESYVRIVVKCPDIGITPKIGCKVTFVNLTNGQDMSTTVSGSAPSGGSAAYKMGYVSVSSSSTRVWVHGEETDCILDGCDDV